MDLHANITTLTVGRDPDQIDWVTMTNACSLADDIAKKLIPEETE